MAAALKPVYTAPTVEAALAELAAFEEGEWGKKYPPIAASWRRAWDQVIPFFTFPPAIRKIIYTTDEIDKPPHGLELHVSVNPATVVPNLEIEVFARERSHYRHAP